MNEIIIKQPAGLGDILFLQKIAHKFRNSGKDVIWPVTKQYISIKEYIPYFNFVNVDDTFLYKDRYLTCPHNSISDGIICTDGAQQNGCGIMTSKYKLIDLDYNDWYEYLIFERNKMKESELYYDILGLKDDSSYTVYNTTIGSHGHESIWDIGKPQTDNIIEIKQIDGFSVFDWCKVLEKAAEFYIMETCFCYLIEILNTKEKKYSLFHRSDSSSLNFKEFSCIYRKPLINIGSEQIKRT
jgi:hypothetical protein